MTKPFLITGLPRCRTAWMSAAATTDRSTCEHEPLKTMSEWRDVFPLWSAGTAEFTGVSDSAMGFHLGEILDRAAPRTLIIWRPIAEVDQSLRQKGFPSSTHYCQVLARRLEAFRGHPLVAPVNFSMLVIPEIVAECLRHLMPGIVVDMNRIDELMDTVIEVDPYETMTSAASRAGDVHALFGEDVIIELRAK